MSFRPVQLEVTATPRRGQSNISVKIGTNDKSVIPDRKVIVGSPHLLKKAYDTSRDNL